MAETLDRWPPAVPVLAPQAQPECGGPSIAIATDDTAAHVGDICTALATLGARGVPFRLADCAFDTSAPHGLRIPGFTGAPPAAVFVRALAGGSFEAVTKRLGILHALGAQGVLVINSAKAMENCVDKAMTSFLLARAGIATPPAWAVETREAAAAVAARELAFGPLVLKPLFGSQGRGLRRICTVDDLPAAEAAYRGLQKTTADQFSVTYGLAQIAEARHDTNAAMNYYSASLTNAVAGSAKWLDAKARLTALQKPATPR